MDRRLLFATLAMVTTLMSPLDIAFGQGTDLYNRRIFLNRVFFQRTGDFVGRGDIFYTAVGKASTCIGCTEARTFPKDFTTNPMKIRKAKKECSDADCSDASSICRWHYMDHRSTAQYPPRMIYGDKDLGLPGSDVTLTLGFADVDRPILPFMDAIGLTIDYIADCWIPKGSQPNQTCAQLQNNSWAAWQACLNTPYSVRPTEIGEYSGTVSFLPAEGYECRDPFTFTNTLKNALARGELWIDQTIIGKGEAWDRPLAKNDGGPRTEAVETIERFRVGQISGTELRLWAEVGEAGLKDPNWLGDHVREWIFPLSVVGNPGNTAYPYCGASHYISIRQTLVGSAIATQTSCYQWTLGTPNYWQEISTNPIYRPYDVYLGNYGVAVTVNFTSINHYWVNPICARSYLLKDGAIISSAPDTPPCSGPGLCIATPPDDDCPEVLDVRYLTDANGITNGIVVEFTEPVWVPAGSVSVVPSVSLTTSLDTTYKLLTIQRTGGGAFAPGQYQLTLNGNLITDRTEWVNRLKAAFNAPCGSNPIIPFCVKDHLFYATNVSGIKSDEFGLAEHIYISGSGFANGAYRAWLVPDDSFEYVNQFLVDETVDGPTLVTVSGGAFSQVDIGAALNLGEYIVVLDVTDNNILDSGDRFITPCEMGLTVGQPCPDLSGEDDLAYFTLDEYTTPFADLTGGDPAGHGGTRVAGTINYGRTFNGSNYIARATDLLDLDIGTADFTLSYWVKSTATTGRKGAIDKRTNSVVGYSSFLLNGKAAIELRTASGATTWTSVQAIADGNWHHVLISLDRDSTTGVKIYIDGQLDFTGDPTARTGSLSNSLSFLIGGDHTGLHMVGSLDEVRVIDGAIPQSHVDAIYMAGIEGQRCQQIPAGVDDYAGDGLPEAVIGGGIVAYPNPLPRGGRMQLLLANGASGEIAIYDVAGRRVQTLRTVESSPSTRAAVWDGKDESGNGVPPGIYFCRETQRGDASGGKIVILE